jgi:hypothetical protein
MDDNKRSREEEFLLEESLLKRARTESSVSEKRLFAPSSVIEEGLLIFYQWLCDKAISPPSGFYWDVLVTIKTTNLKVNGHCIAHGSYTHNYLGICPEVTVFRSLPGLNGKCSDGKNWYFRSLILFSEKNSCLSHWIRQNRSKIPVKHQVSDVNELTRYISMQLEFYWKMMELRQQYYVYMKYQKLNITMSDEPEYDFDLISPDEIHDERKPVSLFFPFENPTYFICRVTFEKSLIKYLN